MGDVATKTAVNIDRELIQQVAGVLGTTGITDTIDAALREIVARAARERLLERLRTMTDEDRDAILHSWD
jgi:Arc/MetJ family transcription regulator